MGILAWAVMGLGLVGLGVRAYYYLRATTALTWSHRLQSMTWFVVYWMLGSSLALGLISQGDMQVINGPLTATLYGGSVVAIAVLVFSRIVLKREADATYSDLRLEGIPPLKLLMQPWKVSLLIFAGGALLMSAAIIALIFGMSHQESIGAAFITQSEFTGALLVFQWCVVTFGGLVAVATIIAWPIQHYRIIRSRMDYEELCKGLRLVPGTPWAPATPRRPLSELHIGRLK